MKAHCASHALSLGSLPFSGSGQCPVISIALLQQEITASLCSIRGNCSNRDSQHVLDKEGEGGIPLLFSSWIHKYVTILNPTLHLRWCVCVCVCLFLLSYTCADKTLHSCPVMEVNGSLFLPLLQCCVVMGSKCAKPAGFFSLLLCPVLFCFFSPEEMNNVHFELLWRQKVFLWETCSSSLSLVVSLFSHEFLFRVFGSFYGCNKGFPCFHILC